MEIKSKEQAKKTLILLKYGWELRRVHSRTWGYLGTFFRHPNETGDSYKNLKGAWIQFKKDGGYNQKWLGSNKWREEYELSRSMCRLFL